MAMANPTKNIGSKIKWSRQEKTPRLLQSFGQPWKQWRQLKRINIVFKLRSQSQNTLISMAFGIDFEL